MANISTLTRAQAAKTMLNLVPRISVENLVRASRFAEKLTRVERDRAVIRALRELFEREHRVPVSGQKRVTGRPNVPWRGHQTNPDVMLLA